MSLNKINVLIAGATGYVGLDLVYLLSKHPKIKILKLCAQKSIGKEINKFDKRIKKKFPLITDLNKTNWNEIDLVFLSLPNGQAQMLVKKLYYKFPNIKFIDLSADFRLENSNEYKKWYKIHHKAKKLISKSIYSVTELVKNKIRLYRIIGNPGCYPTSIQLALNPLFINKNIKLKNIIIDSKSGYSGAGKGFEKKFKHKNLYKSTYSVHGILVQLPLPKHLNEFITTSRISPIKDVDGLTPHNAGLLAMKKAALVACTPSGVMEMFDYHNIDLEGKNIVLINRSNLVGKPLYHLLLEKNATVITCHSKTKEIEKFCQSADIIITAVGDRTKFTLTPEMIKEEAIVIDVAISRFVEHLVGDCDYEKIIEKASFATPVPGGVGPMTVAMLLKNTITAASLGTQIGR